jgi:hypothetical protein
MRKQKRNKEMDFSRLEITKECQKVQELVDEYLELLGMRK